MTRGANVESLVKTDTPLIVSGREIDFKRIKGVYVKGSRAELSVQNQEPDPGLHRCVFHQKLFQSPQRQD